jgi:hypothetical protein
MDSKNENPPGKLLFVVGLWRSGTSLMYTVLNQHPQITIMYEAEPFNLWPRYASAVLPDDWVQRLDLFNGAITRHGFDTSTLPKNPSVRDAYFALVRQLNASRKSKIIGGKSPSYHLWLPEIAHVFPEAVFLIIWRNPLECCRSAAHAARINPFFGQRGMMTRILFGAEVLAKGVECLRREGRQVHEVVYDEFVENPEAEVRRICAFLEIEFEPKMLDLKNADFLVLPKDNLHHHVRSGVIKKNHKYEELLSMDFTAKGRRYANLWRGRYAHLGFARALPTSDDVEKPGWAGQLFDRSVFFLWTTLDNLRCQAYRRIPLSWWIFLRKYKPRNRAASSQGKAASE